jgi:hypothetical protein
MKKISYWLKGGIIGAIIFFIIFLIFQGILLLIGGTPGSINPQLNTQLQSAYFTAILILALQFTFFGFIMGITIGWIIGKIRKK